MRSDNFTPSRLRLQSLGVGFPAPLTNGDAKVVNITVTGVAVVGTVQPSKVTINGAPLAPDPVQLSFSDGVHYTVEAGYTGSASDAYLRGTGGTALNLGANNLNTLRLNPEGGITTNVPASGSSLIVNQGGGGVIGVAVIGPTNNALSYWSDGTNQAYQGIGAFSPNAFNIGSATGMPVGIWTGSQLRMRFGATGLNETFADGIAQEIGFRSIRWQDVGANYNTNGTETGRGLRVVTAGVTITLLGGDNITIINETAGNCVLNTGGALLHVFTGAGIVSLAGAISLAPGAVVNCHTYDGASWRIWGRGIIGSGIATSPRTSFANVSAAGALSLGVGLTFVSKVGATYNFTFAPAFFSAPAVVVTCQNGTPAAAYAVVSALSNTGLSITTFNGSGTFQDQAFSVLATGI